MSNKVVYYTDELNDEFSTAKITAIPIDARYRYGHLTPFFRIVRFLYYRVFAMPIAYLYLKLKWHHRIIGKKEVFRRLYEHTAQDASGHESTSAPHSMRPNPRSRFPIFLYANHTNPISDALIPTFVSFPRGAFVIVHANNVSIPGLWQSTKYLGALPLPDDMAAARNFALALSERAMAGSAICIYPEAHIWPYCTWIRNFPDVSFRYPVQYDAPVISFTNTYQKRGRGVSIITYVDGPFFPDKALQQKERRRALRDAVYNAMTNRAKMSDADIVRYVKAGDRD